jgi:hypothetical protein
MRLALVSVSRSRTDHTPSHHRSGGLLACRRRRIQRPESGVRHPAPAVTRVGSLVHLPLRLNCGQLSTRPAVPAGWHPVPAYWGALEALMDHCHRLKMVVDDMWLRPQLSWLSHCAISYNWWSQSLAGIGPHWVNDVHPMNNRSQIDLPTQSLRPLQVFSLQRALPVSIPVKSILEGFSAKSPNRVRIHILRVPARETTPPKRGHNADVSALRSGEVGQWSAPIRRRLFCVRYGRRP